MLYFLYGPDTYQSQQKLREIIARYQKIYSSGLNLKYFNVKQSNFQEFKDIFQTISMFKEKKLIVLINSFANLDFKGFFIKQGKLFKQSKNTVLFYEEGKIALKDVLFKFLIKNAQTQEFALLAGIKLKHWLSQEIKKQELKVEQLAQVEIIKLVNNDLWRMSAEIKKLKAFKQSKEITLGDVQLLVKSKIETDIFATINALAERDKKKAFVLIYQHLEKGDSILYLLTMIQYQFRNLLIIKEFIEEQKSYEIILKESNLHSFVMRKTYWQAQKFTLKELKKIYQRLLKVDIDIKTGKLNPQTALDLLIAEI